MRVLTPAKPQQALLIDSLRLFTKRWNKSRHAFSKPGMDGAKTFPAIFRISFGNVCARRWMVEHERSYYPLRDKQPRAMNPSLYPYSFSAERWMFMKQKNTEMRRAK